MSFASRMNKVNRWNVDTETFLKNEDGKFVYKSLKDLYEEHGKDMVYPCNGVFIISAEKSHSKYGATAVLIGSQSFVNLPSYMIDDVKEILADDQLTQLIQTGHVAYSIHEYDSHGKTCYGLTWVDV